MNGMENRDVKCSPSFFVHFVQMLGKETCEFVFPSKFFKENLPYEWHGDYR